MIFGFEWIPKHDRQLGYNHNYKSFTNKTYKIRSGMYGFEWTPSNDAQKQFAKLPVTKTLILSESNYKKYDVNGWQIVSSTLPTQAEFTANGMEDLSIFDRTADYSPLDVLNGNFEVVSWTDATSLELYMKNDALPQFVYKSSPETIYGYFDGLNFTDNGKSYYLISYDKIKWYAWDGTSFIVVDTVNMDNIIAQGMTSEMTKTMTSNDWNTWTYENLYIGVYLEDSLVETNKITSKLSLPLESPEINEAKLYVLNTKSTIEVRFAGSSIYGDIKDVDEGKVQYRIILNGANYFPENGEFTPLMASPLNIDTTIPNSKILIDENNTLRIEFQDYWGTTDYWEANFIGTYFGLLFSDATGDYYSTNIGEVLKYLDFGIIIAGQTTLEQEIILKNTYGYSVENVNIKVDKKVLPAGMKGQFGTSNTTFESLDELNFNEIMLDGDEKTFYFRISTELGVTPVSNGKFGIIVTADKVIEN